MTPEDITRYETLGWYTPAMAAAARAVARPNALDDAYRRYNAGSLSHHHALEVMVTEGGVLPTEARQLLLAPCLPSENRWLA